EIGKTGLNPTGLDISTEVGLATLKRELREPRPDRVFHLADAFRAGLSLEDPGFLAAFEDIVLTEAEVAAQGITALDAPRVRDLKRLGFADARIAELLGTDEAAIRHLRHTLGVRPVYKRVDSCAAEFATSTAYM